MRYQVDYDANFMGNGLNRDSFSTKDFLELGRFIEGNFGIKMPDSKKTMVEARLRRRMHRANYQSLSQYLDYVFSPAGRKQEMINLIDTITTNKTDFFREPIHFDILGKKILPRFIVSNSFKQSPTLKIWSSACSSGEEPYTIAMVLEEFAAQNSRFKYSILASDLSTRVLKKAHCGVYKEEQTEQVPANLLRKYFLRSKDRSLALLQISRELQKNVAFKRINLMDDDFGIREKMHIIFCRNVLIYFNKTDQERLIQKFYHVLAPGGFLFIGHSETIIGMNVPLVQIVPTVYKKEQ